MLRHFHDITGARRLARPQAAATEDVRVVVSAAELLQIGEFRLFELAHLRRFGREADHKALEPSFVRYMFEQRAPGWVLHFARAVLARQRQGRLDPAEFGVAAPAPRPADPALLRACNDIMFAVWVAAAYAVWRLLGL